MQQKLQLPTSSKSETNGHNNKLRMLLAVAIVPKIIGG